MYKDTWIVVANSAKARFLKAVSNRELQEEFVLEHEASRRKGTQVDTDRPGRSFDKFGGGRHHLGNLEIGDEEALVFAKTISERLTDIAEKHTLNQLFIIAGPKMLGFISSKLHHNVEKKCAGKVDKDVVESSHDQIRSYLPEVL